MDIQKSFEFLCRVCAANTNEKHSMTECVSILKTPSLRDKLAKYLYLEINLNDSLPKNLCKNCYRQIEATASLSKIAKHTQQVFQNFLLTTIPLKHHGQRQHGGGHHKTGDHHTHRTAAPPVPRQTTPPTVLSKNDEVVLNVSINDPLTRGTHQKVLLASQRKKLLDATTGYAPASIAQRVFLSGNTPKEQVSNQAKHQRNASPSAVLNFYQSPAQKQQAMTKIANNNNNIVHAVTVPNHNGIATNKKSRPVASPLKSSLFVSHDRSAKKTKISFWNVQPVSNTGQVSLLKSSHRQHNKGKPTVTVTPYDDDDDGLQRESVLPKKMIIASTKSNREGCCGPNASSDDEAAKEKTPIPDEVLMGHVIKDSDLLKLILKALKWPLTIFNFEDQLQKLRNTKFIDVISDSNLLQDTDLTQILGPYMNPHILAAHMTPKSRPILSAAAAVTAQASSIKDFAVTGRDGRCGMPYKLPAETSVQLVPASPERETKSPKQVAIKSKHHAHSQRTNNTLPTTQMFKTTGRRRRKSHQNLSCLEVSSLNNEQPDDKANVISCKLSALKRGVRSSPNFQVDIDPTFLMQFSSVVGELEYPNKALRELLERQRAALKRYNSPYSKTANKTTPATLNIDQDADPCFQTDDVILVEEEQQNPTNLFSRIRAMNAAVSLKANATESRSFRSKRDHSKRRKSVIESSNSTTEAIERESSELLSTTIDSISENVSTTTTPDRSDNSPNDIQTVENISEKFKQTPPATAPCVSSPSNVATSSQSVASKTCTNSVATSSTSLAYMNRSHTSRLLSNLNETNTMNSPITDGELTTVTLDNDSDETEEIEEDGDGLHIRKASPPIDIPSLSIPSLRTSLNKTSQNFLESVSVNCEISDSKDLKSSKHKELSLSRASSKTIKETRSTSASPIRDDVYRKFIRMQDQKKKDSYEAKSTIDSSPPGEPAIPSSPLPPTSPSPSINETSKATRDTATSTSSHRSLLNKNVNSFKDDDLAISPPQSPKSVHSLKTSYQSQIPIRSPKARSLPQVNDNLNSKLKSILKQTDVPQSCEEESASPQAVASTPTETKTTIRKSASKMELGQQLMQAVGLQKSRSGHSKSGATSEESKELARDSVELIRSALKQSLREAHALKLRRLELPIVQDADSTTKSRDVKIDSPHEEAASPFNLTLRPGVLDLEEEYERERNSNKSRKRQHSDSDDMRPKKTTIKLSSNTEQLSPSYVENRHRQGSIPNRNRRSTSLVNRTVGTELNTIEEVKEDSDSRSKEDIRKYGQKQTNHSNNGTSSLSLKDSHKTGRTRSSQRYNPIDDKALDPKESQHLSRSSRDLSRSRSITTIRQEDVSDMFTSFLDMRDVRPTRLSKTLSKYYKGPESSDTSVKRSPSVRSNKRN